jgi:hypothetical protein
VVRRAPRRRSLSLGIFVEGPSDRDSIPILLRKLGQRAVHARVTGRGDMLDVATMHRHVQALRATHRGVRRVLVFLDSEGVDPEVTLREAEGPRRELLGALRRVDLDYVVVDHSLEGWLACDEEAVRSVLGRNARLRTRVNPEDHPRPAQLMEGLFRANGKQFRKTVHNRLLAERADTTVIADRSATFRRLVDLLRGP